MVGASPSKPPTVTRPQAARPGLPPPAPDPDPGSPSFARWNALPSRSSRPVISRPGALVAVGVPETVTREGGQITPNRRLLRDVCPPEIPAAA